MNSQLLLILFTLLCVCISSFRTSLAPRLLLSQTRLFSQELSVGEFENTEIKRIETITNTIGKYRVDATISAKDMNVFLNQYKDEMAKRKVVFPGFRAGKLPPYVMGDVRRYIVCFGLETLLGELANINGIKFSDMDGNDRPFGEDSYYKEIVVTDFRGYDYEKQRDAWREGTDFKFACEFYAEADEKPAAAATGKVVDTVAVPADE